MTDARGVYCVVVFIAALFAWIYQLIYRKLRKKTIIGRLFLWVSYILMLVFLGGRICGVGIDDYSYMRIFDKVNNIGIWNTFSSTMMEPGYLALNRIVGLFTNNFQVMIFLVAAISLTFVYAGMVREINNINLFMAFLLFGLAVYPYYFGILRLSLAVSMAFYAIKYVINGDRKKYNILILLAATIHYSALVLLVMNLVIGKSLDKDSLKKVYIKLAFILPFTLVAVAGIIVPLLSGRYSGYVIDSLSDLSILDFDKVLIILFGLFFLKIAMKVNKNYPLYLFMYSLTILITICSIFVRFGRVEWYFNIYVCMVVPSIISALWKKYKDRVLDFVFVPIFILYGFLYAGRLTDPNSSIVHLERYENIFIQEGLNG